MAIILEFAARPQKACDSDSGAGRGCASRAADVVIFPGVRYERWSEDSQPPKRGRRTRQRDMLELED